MSHTDDECETPILLPEGITFSNSGLSSEVGKNDTNTTNSNNAQPNLNRSIPTLTGFIVTGSELDSSNQNGPNQDQNKNQVGTRKFILEDDDDDYQSNNSKVGQEPQSQYAQGQSRRNYNNDNNNYSRESGSDNRNNSNNTIIRNNSMNNNRNASKNNNSNSNNYGNYSQRGNGYESNSSYYSYGHHQSQNHYNSNSYNQNQGSSQYQQNNQSTSHQNRNNYTVLESSSSGASKTGQSSSNNPFDYDNNNENNSKNSSKNKESGPGSGSDKEQEEDSDNDDEEEKSENDDVNENENQNELESDDEEEENSGEEKSENNSNNDESQSEEDDENDNASENQNLEKQISNTSSAASSVEGSSNGTNNKPREKLNSKSKESTSKRQQLQQTQSQQQQGKNNYNTNRKGNFKGKGKGYKGKGKTSESSKSTEDATTVVTNDNANSMNEDINDVDMMDIGDEFISSRPQQAETGGGRKKSKQRNQGGQQLLQSGSKKQNSKTALPQQQTQSNSMIQPQQQIVNNNVNSTENYSQYNPYGAPQGAVPYNPMAPPSDYPQYNSNQIQNQSQSQGPAVVTVNTVVNSKAEKKDKKKKSEKDEGGNDGEEAVGKKDKKKDKKEKKEKKKQEKLLRKSSANNNTNSNQGGPNLNNINVQTQGQQVVQQSVIPGQQPGQHQQLMQPGTIPHQHQQINMMGQAPPNVPLGSQPGHHPPPPPQYHHDPNQYPHPHHHLNHPGHPPPPHHGYGHYDQQIPPQAPPHSVPQDPNATIQHTVTTVDPLTGHTTTYTYTTSAAEAQSHAQYYAQHINNGGGQQPGQQPQHGPTTDLGYGPALSTSNPPPQYDIHGHLIAPPPPQPVQQPKKSQPPIVTVPGSKTTTTNTTTTNTNSNPPTTTVTTTTTAPNTSLTQPSIGKDETLKGPLPTSGIPAVGTGPNGEAFHYLITTGPENDPGVDEHGIPIPRVLLDARTLQPLPRLLKDPNEAMIWCPIIYAETEYVKIKENVKDELTGEVQEKDVVFIDPSSNEPIIEIQHSTIYNTQKDPLNPNNPNISIPDLGFGYVCEETGLFYRSRDIPRSVVKGKGRAQNVAMGRPANSKPLINPLTGQVNNQAMMVGGKGGSLSSGTGKGTQGQPQSQTTGPGGTTGTSNTATVAGAASNTTNKRNKSKKNQKLGATSDNGDATSDAATPIHETPQHGPVIQSQTSSTGITSTVIVNTSESLSSASGPALKRQKIISNIDPNAAFDPLAPPVLSPKSGLQSSQASLVKPQQPNLTLKEIHSRCQDLLGKGPLQGRIISLSNSALKRNQIFGLLDCPDLHLKGQIPESYCKDQLCFACQPTSQPMASSLQIGMMVYFTLHFISLNPADSGRLVATLLLSQQEIDKAKQDAGIAVTSVSGPSNSNSNSTSATSIGPNPNSTIDTTLSSESALLGTTMPNGLPKVAMLQMNRQGRQFVGVLSTSWSNEHSVVECDDLLQTIDSNRNPRAPQKVTPLIYMEQLKNSSQQQNTNSNLTNNSQTQQQSQSDNILSLLNSGLPGCESLSTILQKGTIVLFNLSDDDCGVPIAVDLIFPTYTKKIQQLLHGTNNSSNSVSDDFATKLEMLGFTGASSSNMKFNTLNQNFNQQNNTQTQTTKLAREAEDLKSTIQLQQNLKQLNKDEEERKFKKTLQEQASEQQNKIRQSIQAAKDAYAKSKEKLNKIRDEKSEEMVKIRDLQLKMKAEQDKKSKEEIESEKKRARELVEQKMKEQMRKMQEGKNLNQNLSTVTTVVSGVNSNTGGVNGSSNNNSKDSNNSNSDSNKGTITYAGPPGLNLETATSASSATAAGASSMPQNLGTHPKSSQPRTGPLSGSGSGSEDEKNSSNGQGGSTQTQSENQSNSSAMNFDNLIAKLTTAASTTNVTLSNTSNTNNIATCSTSASSSDEGDSNSNITNTNNSMSTLSTNSMTNSINQMNNFNINSIMSDPNFLAIKGVLDSLKGKGKGKSELKGIIKGLLMATSSATEGKGGIQMPMESILNDNNMLSDGQLGPNNITNSISSSDNHIPTSPNLNQQTSSDSILSNFFSKMQGGQGQGQQKSNPSNQNSPTESDQDGEYNFEDGPQDNNNSNMMMAVDTVDAITNMLHMTCQDIEDNDMEDVDECGEVLVENDNDIKMPLALEVPEGATIVPMHSESKFNHNVNLKLNSSGTKKDNNSSTPGTVTAGDAGKNSSTGASLNAKDSPGGSSSSSHIEGECSEEREFNRILAEGEMEN